MEVENMYKNQKELREIQKSTKNLRKAGQILAKEVKTKIQTVVGKVHPDLYQDKEVREYDGSKYMVNGILVSIEPAFLIIIYENNYIGVYKFEYDGVGHLGNFVLNDGVGRRAFELDNGEYLSWGEAIIKYIGDINQQKMLELEKNQRKKAKENL